jgi:hypothetical protein
LSHLRFPLTPYYSRLVPLSHVDTGSKHQKIFPCHSRALFRLSPWIDLV